jgi:hypothetical protein
MEAYVAGQVYLQHLPDRSFRRWTVARVVGGEGRGMLDRVRVHRRRRNAARRELRDVLVAAVHREPELASPLGLTSP